jgi:phenylacetate-CoA ligase
MIRQRVSKIIATDVQDKLKGLLVSKYYKELKRCLGLSSREVNELQNEKIKKLIHHAWKNVSYYDHLFESENINPDLIKSAEDLNRIPPLTREIIQEHFDELIDKNTSYKRVSKGSSSGSTGQAVSYMHDEFGVSSGKAAHFLGWELGGYQFGDKGLHIWGNPAIVKNVWSKPSSKIMSKLTRIDKFAAFQLTENGRFDQLVETINKNKYDFIDGYTNAIYLLANFIEKNNLKVHKLKYVLTTAENLHDYQREVIERVLGSVFDEYGCGEITGVAYQNKFQPGYAVIDPHVVVEYDKSFSDSSGSHPLIITNLDNMVMPLIRYKNGDM